MHAISLSAWAGSLASNREEGIKNGYYWYIPIKGEAEVVFIDNNDVYRTGSESTFDLPYMEKDGKFVGPIEQPAG